MHAEKMVQRFFETHLGAIHDSRRQVLGSLVWMAMLGSALSLSRLARSLAQRGGTMKSGLKRVDRYVGHPLTFPRLSYGNPEPSSKRGNALRRQWNVQPFA